MAQERRFFRNKTQNKIWSENVEQSPTKSDEKKKWIDALQSIQFEKREISDETMNALAEYLSNEISYRPISTSRKLLKLCDSASSMRKNIGIIDFSIFYRILQNLLLQKRFIEPKSNGKSSNLVLFS